jgi:hypothetical protein
LSTGLVTSLSHVGPGYVGERYANIRRLSLGALYFPACDEGRSNVILRTNEMDSQIANGVADGCILTEIDGHTFLVCYYMFV